MDSRYRPYAGGSIPENYERHLVPLLFADYAEDLASRLDVPSGASVLETACGTGALTRRLVAELPADAHLTVTDLAQAMVEQARAHAGPRADVEYRRADAMDLPFSDNAFDVVVCQFSLMLFPEPVEAMREAARVLTPGGRFVFSVWDRLERNAFSRIVHDSMVDAFPDDPPDFLTFPYAYHDISTIVDGLQDAGFGCIRIDVQPRNGFASGPEEVALGLVAGTPLAAQVLERADSLDPALDAARRAVRRELGAGVINGPMQALEVSARLACTPGLRWLPSDLVERVETG